MSTHNTLLVSQLTLDVGMNDVASVGCQSAAYYRGNGLVGAGDGLQK